MLYGIITFTSIVLLVVYLIKIRFSFSLTLGIAISCLFSIVASICLSQNYTHSLIPTVNDGIGLSNTVAYLLIGEDRWTPEQFRIYYHGSVYVTLFLILLLIVTIIYEAGKLRKIKN